MDLAVIKNHPYATGGVVIVGGLVVFYLLSSSSSSSSAAPQAAGGMSSADYQATLAAQAQAAQAAAQAQAAQAQVQSAAQVQLNGQQVSLAQSQLEAQVATQQTAANLYMNDTNTAAQLAATLAQIQAQGATTQAQLEAQTQQNRDQLTAATTQQANQLTYAQNIQQMQDDVLSSQINAGVLENANNNATALAGAESANDLQAILARLSAATQITLGGYQQEMTDRQTDAASVANQLAAGVATTQINAARDTALGIAGDQTQVAMQGVNAATQVQLAQLGYQYNLSDKTLNMVQQAGLNHGTTSLEDALVGTIGTALGYPSVGVAGVNASSAAGIASSQSTANIISTITNGITNIAGGLFKMAA